MSPERRAEIVAVLAAHQWDDAGWSPRCLCLEEPGLHDDEQTWISEHQVDALVEAGFEPFRPIDVVPSSP